MAKISKNIYITAFNGEINIQPFPKNRIQKSQNIGGDPFLKQELRTQFWVDGRYISGPVEFAITLSLGLE